MLGAIPTFLTSFLHGISSQADRARSTVSDITKAHAVQERLDRTPSKPPSVSPRVKDAMQRATVVSPVTVEPTPEVKPIPRPDPVQDVMKQCAVTGERAPGFAKWVAGCLSHFSKHNPIQIREMDKVWKMMGKDAVFREKICDLAQLQEGKARPRYQSIADQMETIYQEAEEKISGKKIEFVNSIEPCFKPELGYRILGGIQGKPPEWAVDKSQSCAAQSVTDIVNAYSEEGYKGVAEGFANVDSVRRYLQHALERAPEYILKLAMGYRNANGEGQVVCVKAWVASTDKGYPLFIDPISKEGLYQVSEGEKKLYKNVANGETVITQNKGGGLAYPGKNGMPSRLLALDRLSPQMAYRILDYKSDGTVDKKLSLSKLTSCSQFWLYETGKGYPISTTQKV